MSRSFRFTQNLVLDPSNEQICQGLGGETWLWSNSLPNSTQDWNSTLHSQDFLTIQRNKRYGNSSSGTVIWYGDGGEIIRQKFKCPTIPLKAIFCALTKDSLSTSIVDSSSSLSSSVAGASIPVDSSVASSSFPRHLHSKIDDDEMDMVHLNILGSPPTRNGTHTIQYTPWKTPQNTIHHDIQEEPILSSSKSSMMTQKCLVIAILMTPFELRLHMASGEHYDILLPHSIQNIIALPYGLLLYSDPIIPSPSLSSNLRQIPKKMMYSPDVSPVNPIIETNSQIPNSKILSLSTPFSPLRVVQTINSMDFSSYIPLAIHGDLIFLYSSHQQQAIIVRVIPITERNSSTTTAESSANASIIGMTSSKIGNNWRDEHIYDGPFTTPQVDNRSWTQQLHTTRTRTVNRIGSGNGAGNSSPDPFAISGTSQFHSTMQKSSILPPNTARRLSGGKDFPSPTGGLSDTAKALALIGEGRRCPETDRLSGGAPPKYVTRPMNETHSGGVLPFAESNTANPFSHSGNSFTASLGWNSVSSHHSESGNNAAKNRTASTTATRNAEIASSLEWLEEMDVEEDKRPVDDLVHPDAEIRLEIITTLHIHNDKDVNDWKAKFLGDSQMISDHGCVLSLHIWSASQKLFYVYSITSNPTQDFKCEVKLVKHFSMNTRLPIDGTIHESDGFCPSELVSFCVPVHSSPSQLNSTSLGTNSSVDNSYGVIQMSENHIPLFMLITEFPSDSPSQTVKEVELCVHGSLEGLPLQDVLVENPFHWLVKQSVRLFDGRRPIQRLIQLSPVGQCIGVESEGKLRILRVDRLPASNIISLVPTEGRADVDVQSSIVDPRQALRLDAESSHLSTRLRDEVMILFQSLYSLKSPQIGRIFFSQWMAFESLVGSDFPLCIFFWMSCTAQISYPILCHFLPVIKLISPQMISFITSTEGTDGISPLETVYQRALNEVKNETMQNDITRLSLLSLLDLTKQFTLLPAKWLQQSTQTLLQSITLFLRVLVRWVAHISKAASHHSQYEPLIKVLRDASQDERFSQIINSVDVSHPLFLLDSVLYPSQSDDLSTNEMIVAPLSQNKFTHLSLLRTLTTKMQSLKITDTASEDRKTALEAAFAIVQCFLDTLSESSIILSSEVDYQSSNNLFLEALQSLPATLQVILHLSIEQSSCIADPQWPIPLLALAGRQDLVSSQLFSSGSLCLLASASSTSSSTHTPAVTTAANDSSTPAGRLALPSPTAGAVPPHISDGLAEVESSSVLRFPTDERVTEVCRLLRSSRPLYLKLDRSIDPNELEHRPRLQKRLYTLVLRSLSNLVGRGFLTMDTFQPLLAEALPIPPVSLAGRLPSHGLIIPLDSAHITPKLTMWADFHNAVAATLRIAPLSHQLTAYLTDPSYAASTERLLPPNLVNSSPVTRPWIMYNKTASAAIPGGDNSHAGYLLGLGLGGHLSVLTLVDLCEYLTSGHELTVVATLIGATASKIGSACPLLTRALCLHLPALFPSLPHSTPLHGRLGGFLSQATGTLGGGDTSSKGINNEIEISPFVHSSALLGLGLLYARTGHRQIVTLLLEEIERPPVASHGGEGRELITMAAAWALGVVMLPQTPAPNKDPANYDNNNTMELDSDFSDRITQTASSLPAKCDSTTDSKEPFVDVGETPPLLPQTTELHLLERLSLLIHGGNKSQQSSLFSDPRTTSNISSLQPSQGMDGINAYQPLGSGAKRIFETSLAVNTQFTAPSAIVALCLSHLSTGDERALRLLALPQTIIELDLIRPELTLYLTAAQCLVRGRHGVQPTSQWMNDQLPHVLRLAAKQRVATTKTTTKKDAASMGPASSPSSLSKATSLSLEIHSITGLCLGLAITHAGSLHLSLKTILLSKLTWILTLRDRGNGRPGGLLPRTFRQQLDTCLSTLVLAVSLIMAGSGDLECLRFFRTLKFRLEEPFAYGLHMATSMAIGILFCGGGHYSLRSTPFAQATCLLACLPRFPSSIEGNLQEDSQSPVWRHLLVLAVQPRALEVLEVRPPYPESGATGFFSSHDTQFATSTNSSTHHTSSTLEDAPHRPWHSAAHVSTVIQMATNHSSLTGHMGRTGVLVRITLRTGEAYFARAPLLLPPLHTIRNIRVSEFNSAFPLRLDEGDSLDPHVLVTKYFPRVLHFTSDSSTDGVMEIDSVATGEESTVVSSNDKLPPLFVQAQPASITFDLSTTSYTTKAKQASLQRILRLGLEESIGDSSSDSDGDKFKLARDQRIAKYLLSIPAVRVVCLTALDN